MGEPSDRDLDLRLYAVSRDWTPGAVGWDSGWNEPGGDVHPRLYVEHRLSAGSAPSALELDVMNLLKYEKEDGESIHGFLLTTDPRRGEGLATGELARFAQLSQATLELQFRRLRPGASRAR